MADRDGRLVGTGGTVADRDGRLVETGGDWDGRAVEACSRALIVWVGSSFRFVPTAPVS